MFGNFFDVQLVLIIHLTDGPVLFPLECMVLWITTETLGGMIVSRRISWMQHVKRNDEELLVHLCCIGGGNNRTVKLEKRRRGWKRARK